MKKIYWEVPSSACGGIYACGACGEDTVFMYERQCELYYCPRCDIAETFDAACDGNVQAPENGNLVIEVKHA